MTFRERLTAGLSRLSEAESLVGTMQEELVTLGPRIVEKAKVSHLTSTNNENVADIEQNKKK